MRRLEAPTRTRCADSRPPRVQDAPTRGPHAYKMRRLGVPTCTRCADSASPRVQDAPTRRPHAYKMRRLGVPGRSEAELAELAGVALPVLGDLDVQVEVDGDAEEGLDLLAGVG